jgi:hypothetical protein
MYGLTRWWDEHEGDGKKSPAFSSAEQAEMQTYSARLSDCWKRAMGTQGVQGVEGRPVLPLP